MSQKEFGRAVNKSKSVSTRTGNWGVARFLIVITGASVGDGVSPTSDQPTAKAHKKKASPESSARRIPGLGIDVGVVGRPEFLSVNSTIRSSSSSSVLVKRSWPSTSGAFSGQGAGGSGINSTKKDEAEIFCHKLVDGAEGGWYWGRGGDWGDGISGVCRQVWSWSVALCGGKGYGLHERKLELFFLPLRVGGGSVAVSEQL
ncbi:hypothetical protein EDB84DRAFT_1677795 [Lactarius hengduanensis]|nr:hypothetical protein EDB84DRAFT_1677795 [Lactarius hengduanensis]